MAAYGTIYRNPALTDSCTEPGCDEPPHSRNLCSAHYYHRRKAGTLPPTLIELTGSRAKPKRVQRRLWSADKCLEEGCPNPVRARNLCSRHYQRAMQSGSPPPKVRHALEATRCIVEGCAAQAKARKMCQGHYQRSLRYGYTPAELTVIDATTACEACGAPGPFHVDHNHATGDGRGMLCASCNTALGLLGESVPRIVGLLAYLVKHQQAAPAA